MWLVLFDDNIVEWALMRHVFPSYECGGNINCF